VVPGARLEDKIRALEARKAELTAILAEAKEPPAYSTRTRRTCTASASVRFTRRWTRMPTEAAEAIRAPIRQVTLVPENGQVGIVLRGDLAGLGCVLGGALRASQGHLGDIPRPLGPPCRGRASPRSRRRAATPTSVSSGGRTFEVDASSN